MAKLEQLLAAMENPRLLEQMVQGVRGPAGRTRFGLDYERHLGGVSAGVGCMIRAHGPSLFGAG